MNRIDRVTAILIQLQSRKIVKAQDIADRFNISLRTVYRDINTLEEAGVPILGEAGVGYSLMEGYRLPPVMFTKEEAAAFLTAEKFVEKLTDQSTRESYQSGMFKVRSVLRSNEKDMLENIEAHIEVRQHYAPFSGAGQNILQPLLRSIADKEVLHIAYHAGVQAEPSQRDIEPIGIFYTSGYWHCIAYCRLRGDYRDFRADRIQKISGTGQHFDQAHPTLKDYLKQLSQQENLHEIIINVQQRMAMYLQESKYYYGFVSQKPCDEEGMVQMTFLSHPEWFVRWFTMYAEKADIIKPESMRVQMKEYIGRLAEKFS
jgi:predicted DNA-binding transcriptional regulator YafY